MLDKKLKEALDLLGGKAILKEGEDYYILLSLKEFRKIKQEGVEGLTKAELIDKINDDIASWKFSVEENRMNKVDLGDIGEVKDEEFRYEKTA